MNQNQDIPNHLLKPLDPKLDINERAYFDKVETGQTVPWNRKKAVIDAEDSDNVFESCGFVLLNPEIGKGTFSTVYMAHWKPPKLNVAVKVYNKAQADSKAVLNMLPQEVELLSMLQHPNTISFYGALESKFKIYLVFELLPNGNLLEYLTEHGAVEEVQAKRWFAQLCSAVKHCHDLEIAHRDIKCENIMLDMKLNIKLSDFGFAVGQITWDEKIPNSLWIKFTSFCGSPAYMSPEILVRKPYSPLLADVWSTGVVLYCMLYKKFPHRFRREMSYGSSDEIRMIKQIYKPKKPQLSRECIEVFDKIFTMPDIRIRSYELLELKWISDMKNDVFMGKNWNKRLKKNKISKLTKESKTIKTKL